MDESFKWITKAINTSTSQFHLDCCEILIELFETKYKPYCEQELNSLLDALSHKRKSFQNIIV